MEDCLIPTVSVTEHFICSHLIFFFKLVAFSTEFNLFTPICFVLFMIMDLPYIWVKYCPLIAEDGLDVFVECMDHINCILARFSPLYGLVETY